MRRNLPLLILVPAAVITMIGIMAILVVVPYTFQGQGHGQDQDIETDDGVESYTPGYMGTGGFSLDNMSRYARYIVIGTISDTTGYSYQVRDKIEEYHGGMTVDIDAELTGMYNGTKIYFVGPSTNWVKAGDRVLVFLADKEPDSVWGSNYYIIGGLYGLFKIIDGKVYGEVLPTGLPLDDVIKIVEEARANRIRDISSNAKYIVIGRISDITKKPYADTYITVDVEKELTGMYKDKKITLLVAENILKRWGEGKVGERYLFFIKDDLKTDDGTYYIGKSSIYHINDDGIAIGHEFTEGIPIHELEAKIIKFRGK